MDKRQVEFVFGNHKHWTGMVWEWGEDTLANSLEAMSRVRTETGLCAGLNFDGKGFEHLAVTRPDLIEALKSQVREGKVEIWGGTYTQPYGHLLGAESNVRQRQYGVAAISTVLGSRPKLFCEEEFDFFPQLPQLLKQLGYEGAILFYQHTWHTPTFPIETAPAIWWQGVDGTKIKAVPYSRRCLMRGIPTAMKALESEPFTDGDRHLMITWLEMLDKPNWMWRTEFVLPYLKQLLSCDHVEIVPTVVASHLDRIPDDQCPMREYSWDDCYHGICVGKNGDALPRLWRRGEKAILEAEFLAAWCSYLGQPYPQYDSYPTWKLEEAWRMLCLSQGHDAYECEGLTHGAGYRYAQMAIMLAQDVIGACRRKLKERLPAVELPAVRSALHGDLIHASVGEAEFQISQATGKLNQIRYKGVDILSDPVGLPDEWLPLERARVEERNGAIVVVSKYTRGQSKATMKWEVDPAAEMIRGQITFQLEEPLLPGLRGAILLPIRLAERVTRYRVDSPFAVTEVHPNGEWLIRQPTGHWLTSEQRDEYVPRPITHHHFIAVEGQRCGLQYFSSQNSLAIAQKSGFDAALFVHDAWDGERVSMSATVDFGLWPGANIGNTDLLFRSDAYIFREQFLHRAAFVPILGDAHITAIRKVGEELEIRLFETEGQTQDLLLHFLWDVELVRFIDLLGMEIVRHHSISGRQLRFQVGPREIATVRVLFVGKRTENLDLDEHRSIWVGDK